MTQSQAFRALALPCGTSSAGCGSGAGACGACGASIDTFSAFHCCSVASGIGSALSKGIRALASKSYTATPTSLLKMLGPAMAGNRVES